MGVVIVTHLSSRCTRFRIGLQCARWALVGEYETSKLPRVGIVSRMMVGPWQMQKVEAEAKQRNSPKAETLLELRQFGRPAGCANDMAIRSEVLVWRIARLGTNRDGAADLCVDSRKTRDAIEGSPSASNHHAKPFEVFCIYAGEPKVEGIIPHLSVRENIILALQPARGLEIAAKTANGDREEFIQLLGISTTGRNNRSESEWRQSAKSLLARWLVMDPMLILDEPSGHDVGAKAESRTDSIAARERNGDSVHQSELEEVVRDCQKGHCAAGSGKSGDLLKMKSARSDSCIP